MADPHDSGVVDADLTIEQLAAETGLTVRNLRAHRARGLLPPPVVRERVGYYGEEHVARVRLIQELQAEGFNLAGIERLVEHSPGPTEEFLNFKRELSTSFDTEKPEEFTREELAKRFGAEGDDEESRKAFDEGIKRALTAGALIRVDDNRFEAPSPSLLDAAEAVVATGVPVDHALIVLGKVQERARSVAEEFIRLFMEDVWKPFEQAGFPQERWPEVRKAQQSLQPISLQVLVAIYKLTMSDQTDRAFGKQLERLSKRKG